MGVWWAAGWLSVVGILTAVAVLLSGDQLRMIREYRGVDRSKGWAGYAVVVVGSTLPWLLEAGIVPGGLGVLGYPVAVAVFALGVAGVVIGTSHREEYAALRAGSDRRSGGITAGQGGPVTVSGSVDDVAAERFGPWARAADDTNAGGERAQPADGFETEVPDGGPVSGEPDTGAVPIAPFSGVEAVAVEWIYQEYGWAGLKKTWQNEAWGSLSVPFGLTDGDASVVVDPSGGQLFTRVAEVTLTLAADQELPPPTAAFMRSRDDLPDPDDRDGPMRIIERWILADAPVTVVGYPTNEVDPGAADREGLDPGFVAGRTVLGSGEDDDGDLLVITGDLEGATRWLRRRVVWATVVGTVLAILGLGAGILLLPPNVPIG